MIFLYFRFRVLIELNDIRVVLVTTSVGGNHMSLSLILGRSSKDLTFLKLPLGRGKPSH